MDGEAKSMAARAIIVEADSLVGLRELAPATIDAIVTSPPYAEQRAKQYGGIPEGDYPEWTVRWMEAARPALKENASVAIVIRSHLRDGALSDYVLRTRLALHREGWIEPDELIWIKPDAPPLGHVGRPRRSWENILWFSMSRTPFCDLRHEGGVSKRIGFGVTDKGAGDYLHQTEGGHENGVARCRDYCEIRVGSNEEKIDHPAPYPVKLAKWLVGLLTPEDGLVVDPFSGSGTTGVASIQMKRRFMGFEINSAYAVAAQRRLDATQSPTDELVRLFGMDMSSGKGRAK